MTVFQIESFPDSALNGRLEDGRGMRASLPDRAIVVSASDPTILAAIHQPGVHMAIFHRERPAGLAARDLRPLLDAAPFTVTATGTPDRLAGQIAHRAPAPLPTALLYDMTDLAALFRLIDDERPTVRMRLEALDHDGCRKWHADSVGLRLLCTYQGAGTQWLCMEGGAIAAQAMRTPPPQDAIRQIPAGAIAVLKGERYPGNTGNGCIHRSPPASPARRPRLLLCIDQPDWNLDE